MVKIYLAGAMSGLEFNEYNGWRKELKWLLESRYCEKRYELINPVDYYNFETVNHKSEREVMEYDLWRIRTSDLIVVNFNKPDSIGTTMELAIAREHKIPIIGLNDENKELHPWLIEHCTRICSDMGELVEHIINFYIN